MSLDIYKDSSFFKILLEPNSSKLLIPDEFARKYAEILPQEAFFMTEEKFGKCWKVRIGRLDDGRFCFEEGWPEFVNDNPQICALDFAVFKLVDASTFHVSIFGKSGVKKPRHPSSSTPLPQDPVRANKKGKAPNNTVPPPIPKRPVGRPRKVIKN